MRKLWITAWLLLVLAVLAVATMPPPPTLVTATTTTTVIATTTTTTTTMPDTTAALCIAWWPLAVQVGWPLHELETLDYVMWRADDAVQGMWMGQRICDVLGYDSDHVWDDQSILKYLETLVMVHDEWASSGGFYATGVDAIQPLSMPKNPCQATALIRNAVYEFSMRFHKVPPMDIITKLGVTIEQFQQAVSGNKESSVLMDESKFRLFCSTCLTANPNYAKIGRDFGVGVNTMVYYKKLFRGIMCAWTACD